MPLTYQPPDLYPKQRQALFNPARYALIEASTKSGKTVGAMAWLLDQALNGQPNQKFWWVAPVYNQARIAFDRYRIGLPTEYFPSNKSAMTLDTPNGTKMEFKSSDNPNNLYGEDVYAVVMDEASRQIDEAWYAVRSTLTQTQGKVRIIGNVVGRKNWAYRLARVAEAAPPGDETYSYSKITAYDAIAAGVLDLAEIDQAREQLPEHVFRELYLAEPSDDGGNPFGIEAIARCVKPLSDAPPVTFGVDLAKSRDYLVVTGLDADGDVCRFERWQAPWRLSKAQIINIVGSTHALVDSTGVGDPVLEDLQAEEGTNFVGYTFSMQSKQKLMEGLAVAIQQRKISVLDGVMRSELESFGYESTRTGTRYTSPDGAHDDCVMSLALANHQFIAKFKKRRFIIDSTADERRSLVAKLIGSENIPKGYVNAR